MIRFVRQSRLPWLLSALVVLNALGVVYSSHVCRSFYADLQELESTKWLLQEDYSRLLLQNSTLASPHRVSVIAREDLKMRLPELDAARVVYP